MNDDDECSGCGICILFETLEEEDRRRERRDVESLNSFVSINCELDEITRPMPTAPMHADVVSTNFFFFQLILCTLENTTHNPIGT